MLNVICSEYHVLYVVIMLSVTGLNLAAPYIEFFFLNLTETNSVLPIKMGLNQPLSFLKS
jgi:hypothetical protein